MAGSNRAMATGLGVVEMELAERACAAVGESLSALVDGETSCIEEARLKTHLLNCHRCRERLALYRSLDQKLRILRRTTS